MKKTTFNTILIFLAYLISVSCTMTFVYGLAFHNRALSGQITSNWSLIMAAFLMPGALVNALVGFLADLFSKRRIMLLSEFMGGILSLVFLSLFWSGFDDFLSICLYVGLFSLLFGFYEVALDAASMNIAEEKANELVSLIWFARALSYIIGPILGKILSTMPEYLFYVNAGSFFIAAMFIYLIKIEEKTKISLKDVNIFKIIKDELNLLKKYMKQNKIIGFLLITNLLIAFVYMPVFQSIIPDLTKELNIDHALSYIESSSWIGVALAALIVSMTSINQFLLKNLFNTLQIQSLFLFLWMIPIIFNLKSGLVVFYILFIIFDGALNTFQSLGALTYFQVRIPEEVRGKILGAMRTVMKLTSPIGIAVYGIALNYLPWYFMMTVSASVMFLLSFFLSRTTIFRDFQKKI